MLAAEEGAGGGTERAAGLDAGRHLRASPRASPAALFKKHAQRLGCLR